MPSTFCTAGQSIWLKFNLAFVSGSSMFIGALSVSSTHSATGASSQETNTDYEIARMASFNNVSLSVEVNN